LPVGPVKAFYWSAFDMLNQAWRELFNCGEQLREKKLVHLFQAEPTRGDMLSYRLGPLLFDFSKQRIDKHAIHALQQLAHAAHLPTHIQQLFSGSIVNRSEQRAALHSALRQDQAHADASTAEHTAVQQARTVRTQIATLSQAWRDDPETTDVIHVGIGGSDLGPQLVCEALEPFANHQLRIHFVANVDGHTVARLTRDLNPKTTRLCLVSKSFSTQETLLNGQALMQWQASAFTGPKQLAERVVAITSNKAAAIEFGVVAEQILPIWDWVGGRYSLWSAVGLPIALRYGMDVFERLLKGAHQLDEHYRNTPLTHNIPILLALIGVWNRNIESYPTQAVIPYDDRLRLLPRYLQQLDMESNGKRVDEDGIALTRSSAPVIWGDVGTNAQHAFFQSLHQGMDVVPVEFIGVVRPAHTLHTQHRALLANMLAQSAALMTGTSDETGALAPFKACPGNRPSTTMLIDELTPEALGMLLACYEHKIHAQGRLWGINSFDQWGVELGKKIANTLLPELNAERVPDTADASTQGLLRAIYAASK
jgi:glucose-6-phosphate isomerase